MVKTLLLLSCLPLLLFSYSAKDFMFPGASLIEKPRTEHGVVTQETIREKGHLREIALFGDRTRYTYSIPTDLPPRLFTDKIASFLQERIGTPPLRKSIDRDEGFFLFKEGDTTYLLHYDLREQSYNVDLTSGLPTPMRMSFNSLKPYEFSPAMKDTQIPRNYFIPHIRGYHIIEATHRPTYHFSYYLNGRKVSMTGRYWRLTFQKVHHDEIDMCYWLVQNYRTLLEKAGAHILKSKPCMLIFTHRNTWGKFSAFNHTAFLELLQGKVPAPISPYAATQRPQRKSAATPAPTPRPTAHPKPTPSATTIPDGSVYRSEHPVPEGYYDYLRFGHSGNRGCLYEGAAVTPDLQPEYINLAAHRIKIEGRRIDVDQGLMQITVLDRDTILVRDPFGRTRRFVRIH